MPPNNMLYPKLGKASAGLLTKKDIKTDKSGRTSIPVHRQKKNFGDYKKDKTGGTPKTKGVESFIPSALRVAKSLGIPGHQATNRQALMKVFANRVGKGSPGTDDEIRRRMMAMRGRM